MTQRRVRVMQLASVMVFVGVLLSWTLPATGKAIIHPPDQHSSMPHLGTTTPSTAATTPQEGVVTLTQEAVGAAQSYERKAAAGRVDVQPPVPPPQS